MVGTTIKKLQKNKCYCLKQNKDISLKKCDLVSCNRWKKCMTKTNNDINKDLKRRGKNGKKVQKRKQREKEKDGSE